MAFSIKLEVVALVITIMLIMFHHDKRNRGNQRYQLFSLCLGISCNTMLLDIITSITLDPAVEVSFVLNYALNLLYFIFLHFTFSIMAIYAFYLMFEHISDKHCFHIASGIIVSVCIFFTLLSITNPWTDLLFSLTPDGVYMRGPLNKLGYLAIGIELILLTVCYFRNFKLVSNSMHKLMKLLPPIVIGVTVIQILYPDTLLTGTYSALVNLIFFISFQSNRIGMDSLTGLPNRNTFFEEIALYKNKKKHLHLILIHLEHFDEINQKYGTARGDLFIYEIARFLEQNSPMYKAFRFSNTRFIMIGPWHDEISAHTFTQKLAKRFTKHWGNSKDNCYIPALFVHAEFTEPDYKNNHLIDLMEYTLHNTEKTEYSPIVFLDQTMRKQFSRRSYVLQELKTAIEENALQVYYQPLYNCKEERYASAECLLRLFDKNNTMISPGEFIPLAEKYDLMDAISRQLVEKVCMFLSKNRTLPLQSVSINISGQQMCNLAFWKHVHDCLETYQVSAAQLNIEITERAIIEKPALVQNTMHYLLKQGVRFYLDDFGIGYSNLANMLSLPFDTVKLDSSLVKNITSDTKSAQTVALLIQMMHQAGFQVVAEGLETQQQVQVVKSLGVDSIQGFYYAKPMNETDLIVFCKNNA